MLTPREAPPLSLPRRYGNREEDRALGRPWLHAFELVGVAAEPVVEVPQAGTAQALDGTRTGKGGTW